MRRMRRRLSAMGTLIGFSSLMLAHASITTPALVWEQKLDGYVGKGNGVVLNNDQSALWATTSDGAVHILGIVEGQTWTKTFRPNPLTGRTLSSHSTVSLHRMGGFLDFGVYAVIDTPTGGTSATTRVFGVSESGNKVFETAIQGIAVGTPRISCDGSRVYLTHNTLDSTTGEYTDGRITEIRVSAYGISKELHLSGAGGFGLLNRKSPFSEITVNCVEGKETVYWGESWDNGQATHGVLYRYSDGVVTGLGRTSWSTISAPVLSARGDSLWIRGCGSKVFGWTRAPFSEKPSWILDLKSTNDPPITLLSKDNTRLYLVVDKRKVVSIDAETGQERWRHDVGVPVSSLKLSFDDNFLFVSQSTLDRISKLHALNGNLLSISTCQGHGTCDESVEGSFDLSKDGFRLFYADGSATIAALEYDIDVIEPTISPSTAPSSTESAIPSRTPTLPPTPEPTKAPTNVPTDGPTYSPTSPPTHPLTEPPTALPTEKPTPRPSRKPTREPTGEPTIEPTGMPTSAPTKAPTEKPTSRPSIAAIMQVEPMMPTKSPTQSPSETGLPSFQPPTSQGLDARSFDVHLDEFKESEGYSESTMPSEPPREESSNNVLLFSVMLAIAILFLVLVLGLGTMIGRLWQLKRDRKRLFRLNRRNDVENPWDNYEINYLVGKPVAPGPFVD
mmetsp:Transcript_32580/g.48300  ORF Transcript_32580/g.48300 Transcript_32580/m.48300 type:complete len:674 (-) Transcript_32580:644-2665(-)|eukprot:CAMPEP_0194033860 /NCGR_PEP_ID=MMETSP0009_2-20130614/6364_1 /TAXON_ID=210454 /ORGANISM="Grammatophora oceanica, Strain CCMP 410" /LENGTH=673 /DNA_ID=CAMNT_0038674589 /DNA_START=46 /DNA_END=2067 /DNA_ORIENTATION=-